MIYTNKEDVEYNAAASLTRTIICCYTALLSVKIIVLTFSTETSPSKIQKELGYGCYLGSTRPCKLPVDTPFSEPVFLSFYDQETLTN
jgi:hypothetical protein